MAFAATCFVAGTARAQGVSATADSAHVAAKTAGNDAKGGLKHVASAVHHTLKHAGRSAKASLAKATGHKKQDPNHKPGGLNKAARQVSAAFKHAGRAAKKDVHTAASNTHHALKTAGNDTKAALSGKDTTHH